MERSCLLWFSPFGLEGEGGEPEGVVVYLFLFPFQQEGD